MNTPNSPLPSAAGDPSGPSREDGFARVLKLAAQPSGLGAGFAARVAVEARRHAARRRRENLLLGVGLLAAAVGLALCGLLGWTVAPPPS